MSVAWEISKEAWEALPPEERLHVKVLSHEITDRDGTKTTIYTYVHDQYRGRTVGMREMNGYDDSDFYATVFDHDGCGFSEHEYATTRAACAGHANIDASPAIEELYAHYRLGCRQRYARAKDQLCRKALAGLGLEEGTITEVLEFGDKHRAAVFDLLLSKTRAGSFRRSLREQLMDWLCKTPGKRQYASPFSEKQWWHVVNNYHDRPCKAVIQLKRDIGGLL